MWRKLNLKKATLWCWFNSRYALLWNLGFKLSLDILAWFLPFVWCDTKWWQVNPDILSRQKEKKSAPKLISWAQPVNWCLTLAAQNDEGPGATNVIMDCDAYNGDICTSVFTVTVMQTPGIGKDALQEGWHCLNYHAWLQNNYQIRDTADIPRIEEAVQYCNNWHWPGPVVYQTSLRCRSFQGNSLSSNNPEINLPSYQPTLDQTKCKSEKSWSSW